MKIFFDTEFIDDGKTIDLISIGMVREDGVELYEEVYGVDWNKSSRWVLDNVKPHLTREGPQLKHREELAQQIVDFVGPKPEFWAYYASYDWVVLCQLYGTMLSVPKGWPHFCRDLKQFMLEVAPTTAIPSPRAPATWPSPRDEHHALADARWVHDVYKALTVKP